LDEVALISFIAIAWAGLQFGTLWIMQTSILPLLNSRGAQEYLDTCQGIDMHLFHKIALSGGILFMLVGAWLTTELTEDAARISTAVATLGMVGVGLVSEGTNRPIWRRIEKWTIETQATNWVQLRRIWGNAHTLRTVFAFLALAGFTAAAAIEFAS
jgi:hypothetical protein